MLVAPLSVVVSQPHVNAQPASSATQFRVARIHEFSDVQVDSDVQKHDEVIFDLRSPASSPGHRDGVVRTVRFYIGDDPSDAPNGSVRAIVEDMPTGSDMCNILIDSGADASIFPSTMSGFGVDSTLASNRLQDAQGNSIPIEGMKDIEVHLMDQHGRSVILKESVALSSQISQPILCFGHLMEKWLGYQFTGANTGSRVWHQHSNRNAKQVHVSAWMDQGSA